MSACVVYASASALAWAKSYAKDLVWDLAYRAFGAFEVLGETTSQAVAKEGLWECDHPEPVALELCEPSKAH